LIRLTAGDPAPIVSAVCVVSEVRAGRHGGRVFRRMALAVDGEMRGQGLASEAMARVKAYLLLEAGPRLEMKADIASCMSRDGARFYASQGWTGGGGIW
jgi:GNAT superfamily N-acetyltransferase